jgi:putative two-component system response regulator
MGRIAIIDDSEDALELFEYLLHGEHDIRTFARPDSFLHEFGPGRFDLILLDLMMPHVDGFTLFAQIRKEDANVPVVAVTAVAHPVEKDKALAAGFCDYFVKPIIEIERFRQAVFSHVGKCANPPFSTNDRNKSAA